MLAVKGAYGILLKLVAQRGTHGRQLCEEVTVLCGEVFPFRPLARELVLEPLEGVHIRVLILVGVIVMGRAVKRECAGTWLAVRRDARAVVDDGGRERTGRELGLGLRGHGGLTVTQLSDVL